MKFKLEEYMKEQGIERVSVIGQVPTAEYIEILKQLTEGV